MNEVLRITDDRGHLLVKSPAWTDPEPEPSSVVLMNGEFGCAWQRMADDGLWYSSRGGRGKPWSYLLTKRNLVLVYDAAVRP